MAKTLSDSPKAPLQRGGPRPSPPPTRVSSDAVGAAHNFADRRRLDAADRRRREGRELMETFLAGTSKAELSRQKGFCYRTVRRMLSAFSEHAPEEYRDMVAGLRGLVTELTLDDLIYWRSESRRPRHQKVGKGKETVKTFETADINHFKTASKAYHDSCRRLIKLYGLDSPVSVPDHGSGSAPVTTEELREMLRRNPEMAAELANPSSAVR